VTKTFLSAALAASIAAGFVAAWAPPLRATIQDEKTAVGERKGSLKSIDQTKLVLVPDDNKKVEVTLDLGPDTRRSGTLTPGSPVVVRYYFQHGQRVVTEVVGKK